MRLVPQAPRHFRLFRYAAADRRDGGPRDRCRNQSQHPINSGATATMPGTLEVSQWYQMVRAGAVEPWTNWTTTFSVGMFDEINFPIAERTLAAQAAILAVSLCAIVLASLFSERRETEARLASSNMMLQREQDNKLMNIDAITSAIVHEVRQPLTAIAANGNAGIRWLTKTPPNFDEVRQAMTQMVRDSHRASQVLESIRALFKSADLEAQPVDLNEIALGALDVLRRELKDHGVITRTELAPEIPLVRGHSGQLQEVMLNLVRNAIDAMDSITDRARVLQVRTECDGRGAIVVSVEDSGAGIDPEKSDSIFDAFVTTKPQGMGLGLAICRMIISRHEGQLSASADNKSGALFQFTLPIKSAVGSSTRERAANRFTAAEPGRRMPAIK
jgi:signal transduction histidine kinase